jgi:hypothetical protein
VVDMEDELCEICELEPAVDECDECSAKVCKRCSGLIENKLLCNVCSYNEIGGE